MHRKPILNSVAGALLVTKLCVAESEEVMSCTSYQVPIRAYHLGLAALVVPSPAQYYLVVQSKLVPGHAPYE